MIREEFKTQLGEERLQQLEANDWEVVDGSYAYLAKSVPIHFENSNESVRNAVNELHQLRQIVEPHIETVAANHQPD